MSLELFSQILAGLAIAFTMLAFGWRLRVFNALARPVDRSRPKGDPGAGVRYAFTLGMVPWAKESTRRHWVTYLRGIVFHLAILLGLALFLGGPWLTRLPAAWRAGIATATGLGSLFGLAGFAARFVEPNLKALSTPDDYFAVLLVSLFLGAATAALLDLTLRPALYLVGVVMLVYAPLGKIRHCLYYAYARLFFGKFVGRRAVLPHEQQMKVLR
jgi:nitrate reductase gamma subunit